MVQKIASAALKQFTSHLHTCTSEASRLHSNVSKFWEVALAKLNLTALTALLHQTADHASGTKLIKDSPAPACRVCGCATDHDQLQSDGSRSSGSDRPDGTDKTKSTQKHYEKEYVQNCPPLAYGDTTGYVSDAGDTEDDEGEGEREEEAAEVLHQILPYIQMAVAAYKSTSMKEEFDTLIQDSRLISNVIDPTNLFGLVGVTDTEVHVCVLQDKTIVFAFRGTEPAEWSNGFADVLTDLAQGQDTLKLYDGSNEPVYTSQPHIRVHCGFQNALKDVTDSTLPSQNLRLVLQGLGVQAEEVHNVVCVGHSLGGALATLCAKWCREVAFPRAKIGCVTIGSPRVGNGAFASDFNSKVADGLNYRIINKRDVVPSIPNLITYPTFGSAYKHVCKPIYLYENKAGEIHAQLGGTRHTTFNLGFLDHRGHSYLDSIQQVLQLGISKL